jgi:putative solute:sodium symporter small subunit
MENLKKYWRTNLLYLTILLLFWFTISFGCGIIFAKDLNNIKIGGFKLGFWFAQQGAIYGFIVIIFIYTILMNRLDKKHDVDEKHPSAD